MAARGKVADICRCACSTNLRYFRGPPVIEQADVSAVPCLEQGRQKEITDCMGDLQELSIQTMIVEVWRREQP